VDTSIAVLFENADKGDASAVDALFSVLYGELRRLARAQLARSSGGLTLGTTTLLHEAYLDLASRATAAFPDRARFMAYAARAMRGLIIDHARRRDALKRGGDLSFTPVDEALALPVAEHPDLERIGEALDDLSALEPRLAQLVDLKFFCGVSFAEIAAMWGVSERTVQRDWERARIYLHGRLDGASL
jgi:RNA polymerase sigma factor (TIGR02999 family)